MTKFLFRLVSFDIDGTLTTVHGWARIAVEVGRRAEYEATHQAFNAHRESEDVHLRRLLSLATGSHLPKSNGSWTRRRRLPASRTPSAG